jgi:hypothetical protein
MRPELHSASPTQPHTAIAESIPAYTYSKRMDNASGLQDSTYPFDPRRSIALCNFDVTDSFVLSCNWVLPFDESVGSGWAKRHGPGLNNFDMTLGKTTEISESKELECELTPSTCLTTLNF